MKKIIMVLAMAIGVTAAASVDVYTFKSNLKVYSLKSQKYVTTTFNGTLTVDTDNGTTTIVATKKDTKEKFTLTLDGGTNSEDTVFAIVTGKKNAVGAVYLPGFVDEDSVLALTLAGNGAAKTVTTGCGPCGGSTSCTKIKSISGHLVGAYDCGCSNAQHYAYELGGCDLPDDKDTTVCPVSGTWSAVLKTVDGAKYK